MRGTGQARSLLGGYLLGLFGSKGKARMGGNLGDSIHYIRLDSRNIIKTRK